MHERDTVGIVPTSTILKFLSLESKSSLSTVDVILILYDSLPFRVEGILHLYRPSSFVLFEITRATRPELRSSILTLPAPLSLHLIE